MCTHVLQDLRLVIPFSHDLADLVFPPEVQAEVQESPLVTRESQGGLLCVRGKYIPLTSEQEPSNLLQAEWEQELKGPSKGT